MYNPYLGFPKTLTGIDNDYDRLILNGLKFPGLVVSCQENINLEIDEYKANSLENITSSPLAGLDQTSIPQSYTTPIALQPKKFDFTLLIFDQSDAEGFMKIANSLTTGIKFKIKHPKTQMYKVSNVYLSDITTGDPDMVNGWTINLSFIEAISIPYNILPATPEFNLSLAASNVKGQVNYAAPAKTKSTKKTPPPKKGLGDAEAEGPNQSGGGRGASGEW